MEQRKEICKFVVIGCNRQKKEYTFPFSNHISQVKWSPVTPTLIACTYDKEVVVIWSIDNEGVAY